MASTTHIPYTHIEFLVWAIARRSAFKAPALNMSGKARQCEISRVRFGPGSPQKRRKSFLSWSCSRFVDVSASALAPRFSLCILRLLSLPSMDESQVTLWSLWSDKEAEWLMAYLDSNWVMCTEHLNLPFRSLDLLLNHCFYRKPV